MCIFMASQRSGLQAPLLSLIISLLASTASTTSEVAVGPQPGYPYNVIESGEIDSLDFEGEQLEENPEMAVINRLTDFARRSRGLGQDPIIKTSLVRLDHMAYDSTKISLPTFFYGDFHLATYNFSGVRFKPAFRDTERVAHMFDGFDLNCSAWKPVVKYPIEARKWVGVCNKTQITFMSFHYYSYNVIKETFYTHPNALECLSVFPANHFGLLFAFCKFNDGPGESHLVYRLVAISFDGGFGTYKSNATLEVGRVPETKPLISVLNTTSSEIVVSLVWEDWSMLVTTYSSTISKFKGTVHFYSQKEGTLNTTEFNGSSPVHLSHNTRDLMAVQASDKTIRYFNVTNPQAKMVPMMSVWLAGCITPLQSVSFTNVLQIVCVDQELIKLFSVRYDDGVSGSITYRANGYPIKKVITIENFGFGTFGIGNLIVVGRNEKNNTVFVICNPNSLTVEADERDYETTHALIQTRGLEADSYEIMVASRNSSNSSYESILVSIGQPQIVVNMSEFTVVPTANGSDHSLLEVNFSSGKVRAQLRVQIETLLNLNKGGWLKLPQTVQAFIGQRNFISLPDEAFGMNAPMVTFVSNDTSKVKVGQIFTNNLTVRYPKKLLERIDQFVHIGKNFFLLKNQTEMMFIGCTMVLGHVTCSNLFKTQLEGTILSAAYFNGNFLVLTTITTPCSTLLLFYDMDGSEKPRNITWPQCPLYGTLRVHDNEVSLDLIAYIADDERQVFDKWQTFIYTASFQTIEQLIKKKVLDVNAELSANLCPIDISWGYSQLSYLNIDSFCMNNGHYLATLDIKPNGGKSMIKNIIKHSGKMNLTRMCSTGFDIITFDFDSNKIVVHSTAKGITTYSEVPLQFYGLKKLLSYSCVPDESYIVMTALDSHGTTFILAYSFYRGLKPAARIKCLMPLRSNFSQALVATGSVENRNEIFALTLFPEKHIIVGTGFVLGTPKVYIDVDKTVQNDEATVTVTAYPLGGVGSVTLGPVEILIKLVDQLDLKLEKDELNLSKKLNSRKIQTMNLEKLYPIDFPLVDANITDGSDAILTLRPRIEPIESRYPLSASDSYRSVFSNHNVTILWNSTDIKVYEGGDFALQAHLPNIVYASMLQNVSEMSHLGRVSALVLTVCPKDQKLYLNLIFKANLPTHSFWTVQTVPLKYNFQRIKGIYYQLGLQDSVDFHLIGHCSDSRIMYEINCVVNVDLNGSSVITTNLIDESMMYTFDSKITLFDVLSLKNRPFIVAAIMNSNKLYFLNLLKIGKSVQMFDVRFPVWQEEFLGGNIACDEVNHTSCAATNQKMYLCLMTNTEVSSFLINVSMSLNSSQPPKVELLKTIDNIKGFIPLRGVVTAKYTGIYFHNLNDDSQEVRPLETFFVAPSASLQSGFWPELSSSSSSSLLGTDRLTTGSSGMYSSRLLQRPSEKNVLHKSENALLADTKPEDSKSFFGELSVVGIYRNQPFDRATKPFAVLPFSKMQSLDSSKLQSIFFDLDEIGPDDTQLVVNAKFETRSIIKRFRLQDMSLEVRNPGRVHLRKTKIVLTGIDSRVVIPLSDIFKRNWTRLIVVWTLFVLFGVSLFLIGAYFIVTRSQAWKSATKNEDLDESQDLTVQANMSLLPDKDNN